MIGRVLLSFALAWTSACCMTQTTSTPTPTPTPTPVLTCAADADCLACPMGMCGCGPATGTCAPSEVECVVDPCHEQVPRCRSGQCVIEHVPAPIACTRDDECRACGAQGCNCIVAGGSECPPMPHGCAADPCSFVRAVCREGFCAAVREMPPPVDTVP